MRPAHDEQVMPMTARSTLFCASTLSIVIAAPSRPVVPCADRKRGGHRVPVRPARPAYPATREAPAPVPRHRRRRPARCHLARRRMQQFGGLRGPGVVQRRACGVGVFTVVGAIVRALVRCCEHRALRLGGTPADHRGQQHRDEVVPGLLGPDQHPGPVRQRRRGGQGRHGDPQPVRRAVDHRGERRPHHGRRGDREPAGGHRLRPGPRGDRRAAPIPSRPRSRPWARS